MKDYRIEIEFDGAFVLSRREDAKLPTSAIVYELDFVTDITNVVNVGFSRVSFVASFANEQAILEAVEKAFETLYPETPFKDTVFIEISELNAAEAQKEVCAAAAEKADETASAKERADEPYDSIAARFGLGGGRTEKTDGGKRAGSAEEVLKTIDALAGATEFKALAHETAAIAAAISADGASDVFMAQSYLFSVGEGAGLTTYLGLFAKLVTAAGIRKIAAQPIEVKLGAVKDGADAFNAAKRELSAVSGTAHVLCIDISEWMNATDDDAFREFSREAIKRLNEFILVYRVPYVDKYVLEKIRRSIDDMVYVRSVVFEPFGAADLRRCAENLLGSHGYEITPGAWQLFDRRIVEEGNDGRFYGMKTVKKVVMELLYDKYLYDARRGKFDKRITRAAIAELCSGEQSDGTDDLKSLVGSEKIVERVNELIAQIELAAAQGGERPCIHMRFTGNPGTGKTTVARIIGKMLKSRGILSVGNFFERSGRDFCGRYIGETAPKTMGICRDAYGSVLFIDEAYSLYRGDDDSRDFGREAIDTLVAEMENHRGDFVVIMAGYPDEMEKLMSGNPGLKSRMPYLLEFPDFTRSQLADIFDKMCERCKCADELAAAARKYFESLPDEMLKAKGFGNARFVRNLFERTRAKAALRVPSRSGVVELTKDDFERASNDTEFRPNVKAHRKIGFQPNTEEQQ